MNLQHYLVEKSYMHEFLFMLQVHYNIAKLNADSGFQDVAEVKYRHAIE